MSFYVVKTCNDDELMHWKYIKRYRKNGKWVYVYADQKTHGDITIAKRNVIKAEESAEHWKKAANRNKERENFFDKVEDKEDARRAYEYAKKYELEDLGDALANARKVEQLISDNSIDSLIEKQIDRAKNWVNNFLNRK